MPVARFQMPDGRIARFEVPEGLSPEEAQSMIESSLAPQAPQTKESVGRTALEQGLQGASFGFADEVTDRIGAGIASLATGEKYGDLLKEARGNTEQRFARQFEQNPVTSIGANIGGALLTGGAGATTKAGSMLGNSLRTGNTTARVAKGALAGAASGGLYGAGAASDGRRLEGAGQGAALGGLVGGAIPAVGTGLRAAKRAATPVVDDGLREVGKLAQKFDIPLSLDQVAGSRTLKNLQKVTQELPFSGQDAFRDKQLKAWQRALMKTVGQESDNITPEVMDKAFTEVGQEFDNLAKGRSFKIGNEFEQRVQGLMNDAKELGSLDAERSLRATVNRLKMSFGKNPDASSDVARRSLGMSSKTPQWTVSGERLSKERAKINALARKSSNDATGSLLRDLENIVIDVMTEGDDVARQAFGQTKYKYKNLLAIEPLAVKAKGGNISPSMLNQRVARIYDRAHTTGKVGDIGDLARIGHELLPELGGSDTTQKMLYAAGIGGALANPGSVAVTGTALGAGRAFQSGINRNQNIVNNALNRTSLPALRPASAAGAIPAGAAAGAISAPREGITQQITPQSYTTVEQAPLFDRAFQHVLDVEGGYVADDAGKGETNMGVNTTANPDVDIKNLTKPEARNIYKKRYWDAIGADKMPPALAMVAFDGAVNQGVGKTKELLKKSGGDPMTLLKLREQHYANLIRMNPKKFAKYGNGWMDRLKKLEQMIMEG